ncbi:PIN domain-containing protein [soil metagenome]
MIVVDASVLANALGDDYQAGRVARDALRRASDLAAPDLVDVEAVSVLRKRWLTGALSSQQFETAAANLERLDFERVPTLRLMRRAFELRANVTAYDASYVALAEALDCELLTGDRRLATAPGLRCPVRVLSV